MTDASTVVSPMLALALQKLHEDSAWLRPLQLQQLRVQCDASLLLRVQPLTQICRPGGGVLKVTCSLSLSLYITCSLALRGCPAASIFHQRLFKVMVAKVKGDGCLVAKVMVAATEG